MLHLFDAVKAASVPRFRTDHGQGTPESTFEKGVALVNGAVTAPPNTIPATAALRLASFLDRTLNSQSKDVRKRI
jgi:predicted nucleotidyltransferase